MKCHCGGAMKPLFTSWFCPACDERKAKYDAAYKKAAGEELSWVEVRATRAKLAGAPSALHTAIPPGPSAYGPPVAAPALISYNMVTRPVLLTPCPWCPDRISKVFYSPGGLDGTAECTQSGMPSSQTTHRWIWQLVPRQGVVNIP